MTNPNETMLNALREVAITTEILIKGLEARDLDKAEAALGAHLTVAHRRAVGIDP